MRKKKKPVSFPHYKPIKSYSNDCKTRRNIRLDTFGNFCFFLETRRVWIFHKAEISPLLIFLKIR